MDAERRQQELAGIDALIRAGNGDDDNDRYESSVSVGSASADSSPWTDSVRSFFVTGQDVLTKIAALEAQALSLGHDIETQNLRPLIKQAWLGWYGGWKKKATSIRDKNLVSLNLAAGHLMDELDVDQAQLSQWRETLLAEGGTPTGPSLATRSETRSGAENEVLRKASSVGNISFGEAIKWIGIVGAMVAGGYVLKGLSDTVQHGGSFIETLRGKKYEGGSSDGEPRSRHKVQISASPTEEAPKVVIYPAHALPPASSEFEIPAPYPMLLGGPYD